LDVLGVHGIGGVIGMVLLGLFAARSINATGRNGLFSGGGFSLLGEQLLAVVVTVGFCFGLTYLIAQVVDRTIGLRVDEDAEFRGLDVSQHAETAYS
jgi:Amt family ammonium transporter